MMRTQISLTEEARRLLDEEAAQTGRSISALIRDAVMSTYGSSSDAEKDVQAIQAALGGWADRDVDGAQYVDALRSGRRIPEAPAQ